MGIKIWKGLLPTSGRGLRYISQNKVPLAFIAPSFLGVLVFVLIPFADVLKRSFFTATGSRFVGMSNYLNVFSNDAFKLAAGNTLKFVAVCIPALVAMSLVLALLVSGAKSGGDTAKSVFLLPLVIPAASMVLIWKLFFHNDGLLNSLTGSTFGTTVPFMASAAAFWVLTVSYLWKNMGYDMVLWMGGLSKIPLEIYEAAAVDGAGNFRRFFSITLPNLVGVLFMVVVLSLLNSFKVFREAYLVAGEYPHTSMYMLQHLFNNWFTALDIEKLCAGAVVMAIVIFILISLWMRLIGEGDD
ncbi:MAG: sugar ABC transporter permease [Clostridiales bacterium]|nr:sugar ABC transporter permease [Clostridiales bacterium]